MKSRVKIGTCGFGRTKEEYVEMLSTVEIQHTFYQPPQIKTLERWREIVSPDFEFTLKAWQLITHESKSPTYKRLKKKLTEEELADAGYFKPTAIVKEAWETTRACAEALKAKTILFQCPASLKPTGENIENIKTFFTGIERGDLNFCWEPRGKDWTDEIVREICAEFDLWHTVDPFVRNTVTPEKIYFRLHGRGGWRYKYEEGELEELASMLPEEGTPYVFFNNREMLADAMVFEKIVREMNL
jgi:uncharacterized protein YecE (DUF72 family)